MSLQADCSTAGLKVEQRPVPLPASLGAAGPGTCDDAFCLGLRRYLRVHAYGATTPADLWSAISSELAATGDASDVSADMATWTEQPGYPVVTLTLQPADGAEHAHADRLYLPASNLELHTCDL